MDDNPYKSPGEPQPRKRINWLAALGVMVGVLVIGAGVFTLVMLWVLLELVE